LLSSGNIRDLSADPDKMPARGGLRIVFCATSILNVFRFRGRLGASDMQDLAPVESIGYRIMPDGFSNALLAALNEAVEVDESDWNSIASVLRAPIDRSETRPRATASIPVSENRFAATISCGMARAREAR